MGHVQYKMIKNEGKDTGGMMKMDGDHFEGVPPHWLVYIAVEDCEKASAKALSTGGKVLVATTEIAVGSFSVISDPQGAVLGLIQLKEMAG